MGFNKPKIEANAPSIGGGGAETLILAGMAATLFLAAWRTAAMILMSEHDGVLTHHGDGSITISNREEHTSTGDSHHHDDAPECNNPSGHVMRHTTTYDAEKHVTISHWQCMYCDYNYTVMY